MVRREYNRNLQPLPSLAGIPTTTFGIWLSPCPLHLLLLCLLSPLAWLLLYVVSSSIWLSIICSFAVEVTSGTFGATMFASQSFPTCCSGSVDLYPRYGFPSATLDTGLRYMTPYGTQLTYQSIFNLWIQCPANRDASSTRLLLLATRDLLSL